MTPVSVTFEDGLVVTDNVDLPALKAVRRIVTRQRGQRGAVVSVHAGPERYVGVTEIAELYGVSRQRVSFLTSHNANFPAPVARLASGPVWREDAVLAFKR